ncbi:MAG: molybdopterin-guanine dinucleotide biosynthesis protein B [Deltaproteobacteria bacterium]|nr:molybdopterin-guanine dinucleotide biosynthesis protein B [Deltaproteobacteria bacterium]
MTIPIVSITGKSNTGKTTLIEKMIRELKLRGYRVATIKHTIHGFDVDREGKDSWRHKQAGAQITVIASPKRATVIEDMDVDLEIAELRDRYITGVDIVLSEGFKGNPFPKIEVFRPEIHPDPLCTKEDNLIAVVSEAQTDRGVPLFKPDDIQDLVDLVENLYLKKSTL